MRVLTWSLSARRLIAMTVLVMERLEGSGGSVQSRRSGPVTGKIANDAAEISQLWDDLIKAGIRDHKLHVIDAKDADSLAYETAK